jgi:hypothetical protein
MGIIHYLFIIAMRYVRPVMAPWTQASAILPLFTRKRKSKSLATLAPAGGMPGIFPLEM